VTRPPRLVLLSLGVTVALGIAIGLLMIAQESGTREKPTAPTAGSEVSTQGTEARQKPTASTAGSEACTQGTEVREEPTAPTAGSDVLTREQAAALVSRMTGQYGNWVPNTKYYNPKLPLSAVIGETKGGTATSPKQLYFFHKGVYVGPATPEARFAFWIVCRSDDLIMVRYSHYRKGDASCCASLPDYVVRYKWIGRSVRALDPIPPESQGWW
jgi:LppP/LprE lipoprotein